MLDIKIFQPKTLDELWYKIKNYPKPRKFLAGGTDLVLSSEKINFKGSFIDINKIKELKKIKIENGKIFIAAAVTFSEILNSNIIKKHLPCIYNVAEKFALPPIRNLATIGGNCGNASPAGDSIPAIIVEEGRVVIRKNNKIKTVPIEKFFLGVKKTILKDDELIYGFTFPKNRHNGIFLKLAPRGGYGISKVSCACAYNFDKKTFMFNNIKIALGAVGPTVIRALKTEKILQNNPLNQKLISLAIEEVKNEVRPITDHRSTETYRREMSGVLLKRILNRIYYNTM